MISLLLASSSKHKACELAQLLGHDAEIRALCEIVSIEETGSTLEENATIKALIISRLHPGELVLADDSGLEVDALGGAPGIRSARFAGEDASDVGNVEKLLRELANERQPTRSARFRCVLALARGGDIVASFAGKIDGTITETPRGGNGFGYDPVFIPDGYTETFAQLLVAEKNRISHRARAAAKLRDFLSAR